MIKEIEFRGYILENEDEKKQIIISNLVNKICEKYIDSKVDGNLEECKRLSIKLHELLNKFDRISLYKSVCYVDSFINEILNFGHMEYKKYNKDMKDIQYFFKR